MVKYDMWFRDVVAALDHNII